MFSCDSLISIFFWLYFPKMTIKLTIATGRSINVLKTPELYPVSLKCVSFYIVLFVTARNASLRETVTSKASFCASLKLKLIYAHFEREKRK